MQGGQKGCRILGVLEEARNVRHQHELAHLERLRQRRRRIVRIDIVKVLVVDARPQRRDHRDDVRVEHLDDRARRHLTDLADIPAIGLFDLPRGEKPVAVKRLRIRAAVAETLNDVGIHHVVERLADDLHRLRVRHPQPFHELRLVAGHLDCLRNRLAAAVHNHDLDADGIEKGNVIHNGVQVFLDLHHRSAELDEDDRPLEILNVRQSLGQNRSFRLRCVYSFHCL